MAYATVGELTAKLGSTPVNAQQLLDRASRHVDQALLCAVYDPDLPANTATLKEATLEQVAAALDAGDTKLLGTPQPTGFTLGRLSVQRSAGRSGAATAAKVGQLYEQAWMVLQQAGLTGHGPQGR